MQKLSLQNFHFRINIERLPTLSLYTSIGLTVVCLAGAILFTYKHVYVPYTSTNVPEEKLTQKQDKLNVKDFDAVRAALDAKQQGNPSAISVDPFQVR
jgi:hypothetical protein